MKTNVYIGTSGWVYGDWAGVFYPPGLKPKEQLPFFAKCFNTVEINTTFYRIPRESVAAGWRDATPDDFVFAVKLNSYLTHAKRLILDDHSCDRLRIFLRAMEPLQDKSKALLVQLSPSFRADVGRLDSFLKQLTGLLPKQEQVFCEFRHPSWLTDKSYNVLRAHGAGFVIPTYPGRFRDPYPVTGNAVYIRYHATASRSNYSSRELDKWAEHIRSLDGKVSNIFAYFNNDYAAHAIINAQYLQRAL